MSWWEWGVKCRACGDINRRATIASVKLCAKCGGSLMEEVKLQLEMEKHPTDTKDLFPTVVIKQVKPVNWEPGND